MPFECRRHETARYGSVLTDGGQKGVLVVEGGRPAAETTLVDTGRDSAFTIAALGILTITAYGGWYYGYGVIVDPIHHEEGWSTAALGVVFGAAILVNGVGAALGGRLLDHNGPRRTFITGAVLGAGALFGSAWQHNVIAFGTLYAIGGGTVGALGFYHTTQAAAMRSSSHPARAVARLTMIGAFSSPIFLPMAAWLVQSTSWRTTITVESALVAASFVLAAWVVPDHRGAVRPSGRSREAFARAWTGHLFRRLLISTLLSGIAADIMLAFQVPIMRSAGLPLATAAVIAGLRGLAQLLGRVPLSAILRSLPSRRALAMAHATAAVAAILLIASGSLPIAICYGLVAGAATGAASPLAGIHTAELVPTEHLGLLLGVQQALYGVAGAAGPIAAGVLLSSTGSWVPAVVLTAAGFAGAAILLSLRRPKAQSRS